MEKTIEFRTKEHYYLYHRERKLFYWIHPLICLYKIHKLEEFNSEQVRLSDPVKTSGYTDEELEYYFRKYRYFQKMGIITDEEMQERIYAGRITSSMVERNIANIQQVVFEMTEKCNLRCKYCGYGELYGQYDPRQGADLSREKAFRLLDYLISIWSSEKHIRSERKIGISFYGGEPLVNFPLIKEIVEYLDSLQLPHIRFMYNMTTNAVLLDRYLDFIAEHRFHLLISLDGDREGNGYRIRPDGQIAFDQIMANVRLLRERYPDYFDQYVNFNTVLHRKNSVGKILSFFEQEWGKVPRIAELTTVGVRPDKKTEFLQMFQNMIESVRQTEDVALTEKKLFVTLPTVRELTLFLHQRLGFIYSEYTSFFREKKNVYYIPTGTCMPLGRKMFMTATGKILPCENVPHHFSFFGRVDEKVSLDSEEIAGGMNQIYDTIEKQCSVCYKRPNCMQCIFLLDEKKGKLFCQNFMSRDAMLQEYSNSVQSLENRPGLGTKIFNDVVIA